MTADRVLDLAALLALACVAGTGAARIAALARSGVQVLPIDRQRSIPQALVDLAAVLGMLAWVVAVVVAALGSGARPGAAWLAPRWLGLAAAAAGVVLYAVALRDMGLSWRFTIDRERPGELVTTGIFARSRNPIYLSLVLVALGVSLALGRPFLAALACGAPLYFHYLIRREERFLAAHYGQTYARYCERTSRWWRWRRH
jgi:protein-S-isoprenylcysteine O-methyltransferase Ste14